MLHSERAITILVNRQFHTLEFEDMTIDSIDRQLIRCLQEDPRARYATIARRVNISESTVRRRIDALIESGAIVTSVLVDLHLLGFRSSAIVGMKADLDKSRAIGNLLTSMPEVTYVAVTTGRYDVVFHVAARTLEELQDFLAVRIARIRGVRDVEVMVMPRMLKGMRDWRLPLDGESIPPTDVHDSQHSAAEEAFAEDSV